MPTRNAPTAAETWSFGRDAGDQQGQAEHPEQERLRVLGGERGGDQVAVPDRHGQHHDDGEHRDGERDAALHQADPGEQRGDQRQVEGHRQVLDHQDGEDHRRLPVTDPAQVAEHLGDHARGRHPGDASEHHCGDPAPPEQQREPEAGQRVEHRVDQTGRRGRAEVAHQFVGAVLQAEHDQQQDHADLGADGEELLAGVERQQATVPERQAGEQVERDGRDTDATAQPAEQAEQEQQRTDLDEQDCGFVHTRQTSGSVSARIAVTPSSPWRVPTTTTTSPASNRKVGSGETFTVP